MELLLPRHKFCVHHTTIASLQCHFIRIHIHRVHVGLAVTYHLRFWQNGRDLLRATAVTRGWNGYRNKSQHRKSTLEKKILPPPLRGFELATFQSRVRHSNHRAIPAPANKEVATGVEWGGGGVGALRAGWRKDGPSHACILSTPSPVSHQLRHAYPESSKNALFKFAKFRSLNSKIKRKRCWTRGKVDKLS